MLFVSASAWELSIRKTSWSTSPYYLIYQSRPRRDGFSGGSALSKRIIISNYRISATEYNSFMSIGGQAAKEPPEIPGFAFLLFVDANEHHDFTEMIVLPYAAEHGQDTSMEGYHFASSYQPERNTCIEPGSPFQVFQGTPVAGDLDLPVSENLLRITQLWADTDDAPALEEALTNWVENAPARNQLCALKSLDHGKLYGLVEIFTDQEAMDGADTADRDLDESLGSVQALIRNHVREAIGSNSTRVRCS